MNRTFFKKLTVVSVAALAGFAGLTACGNQQPTPTPEQPAKVVKKETPPPAKPKPTPSAEEAKCAKPATGELEKPVTLDNACTYVQEAGILLRDAGTGYLAVNPTVKVHVIGVDESAPCDGASVAGGDTDPVRWCQAEGEYLVVDKAMEGLLQKKLTDVAFSQVMDAYGLELGYRHLKEDDSLLDDDQAWYAGGIMARLVSENVFTKEEADAIGAKIYITPKMQAAFDDGFAKIEAQA